MRKYRKGSVSSEISVDKGLKNREIGDDLTKFIDLLKKFDFCSDYGSMDHAGGMCTKKANETQWSYNGSIIFNIDTVGSSHPLDLDNLRVVFTIDIKAEQGEDSPICDPLQSLNFDIEIYGTSDSKGNDIVCCWHLDRNKEINANPDHYSHPKYHLTFGGDKLPETGDYGKLIILPSPRIAYPPMDAVLGIDFIIQNYIDRNKTKTLIHDPTYREIVDKSQRRLWKPYYHSISSKWDYNVSAYDEQFNHTILLPFLM